MKTYKCMVVDDEPLARKIIVNYINELPEVSIVYESGSPLKAMEYLNHNEVHILFLDINMPKISGLSLVKQLEVKPLIIFTTAYTEHAVEAFSLEAFDYLVKPISFERFLQTWKKVKRYFNEIGKQDIHHKESLIVKEGKRLYKIDQKEILYVKAFGDYVRIFTPDKTYITKVRFSQIIRELSSQFQQVHRSYAINLTHLDYVEGNHISIAGEKITISESFKNELMKKL